MLTQIATAMSVHSAKMPALNSIFDEERVEVGRTERQTGNLCYYFWHILDVLPQCSKISDFYHFFKKDMEVKKHFSGSKHVNFIGESLIMQKGENTRSVLL